MTADKGTQYAMFYYAFLLYKGDGISINNNKKISTDKIKLGCDAWLCTFAL